MYKPVVALADEVVEFIFLLRAYPAMLETDPGVRTLDVHTSTPLHRGR
jgi:hypothetical protein